MTPGSTSFSSPYAGSNAIKLGPSRRNLVRHEDGGFHVVVSGIKDVTTPELVSAGYRDAVLDIEIDDGETSRRFSGLQRRLGE